MHRLRKQQPRAINSVRAAYTLKQTCQVVGIDSKTLHKWLKDLEITPVEDRYDHRIRLLSEEQVQQLVIVAQRRRHVSHTPKNDTPLGGYIRTVKDLSRRVDELQETLVTQAEFIKGLGEVRDTLRDALRDTLQEGGQQTLSRIEEKNSVFIAQLEARAEDSALRFAKLVSELETLVASLAKESGRDEPEIEEES